MNPLALKLSKIKPPPSTLIFGGLRDIGDEDLQERENVVQIAS